MKGTLQTSDLAGPKGILLENNGIFVWVWHVFFLFCQDIIATGRTHWVYTSVGSNGIVLAKCLWLTCVDVGWGGRWIWLLVANPKFNITYFPWKVTSQKEAGSSSKHHFSQHARKISEVWYRPVTSLNLGTGDFRWDKWWILCLFWRIIPGLVSG